jgi:uncharacterized protein (DUF1684 family)
MDPIASAPDTDLAPRLGSREVLDLLDWKRTIFELYARIRAAGQPKPAHDEWRSVRDRLFRDHPQSPLAPDRRGQFSGCSYYRYDPSFRVLADITPTAPTRRDIVTSTGAVYAFSAFAHAGFELGGQPCSLELFWLEGYGGGLFLPFGDDTSGETTYPAGRYLLDTTKGADLGGDGDRLVLDFNFAYNPSCAYDPQWVCPLAPTSNWLPLAIEAGEKTP